MTHYLFVKHEQHGIGVDLGPIPASYSFLGRVVRFRADILRVPLNECKFQWAPHPIRRTMLGNCLRQYATSKDKT